jgi:hypothetical protein
MRSARRIGGCIGRWCADAPEVPSCVFAIESARRDRVDDRRVDARGAHASVRRCVARRLDADSIDQSTGPRFAVS